MTIFKHVREQGERNVNGAGKKIEVEEEGRKGKERETETGEGGEIVQLGRCRASYFLHSSLLIIFFVCFTELAVLKTWLLWSYR